MEFTGLRGAQAAVLFLGNEADRHCWTNGHADTILARDMSSVGTLLEASLVVEPPLFRSCPYFQRLGRWANEDVF